MKENIDISEFDKVFRQQLENAGVQPPPGVWEGIASGLSTATAATTTVAVVKTALWVKVGIGIIATAAIASAIYISIPAKDNAVPESEPVSVNTPQANIEEGNDETSVPAEQANEVIAPSASYVKKEIEKGLPVAKTVTPDPSTNETQMEVVPQPYEFRLDPQMVEKQEINPPKEEKTIQAEVPASDPPYEQKNKSYVVKTDSSFILIPDVFTPNGDGVNDTYLIDIKGEESVRIMIFNSAMYRVFETTNKLVGWTGVMPNGELYPDGSYIVKVIYKFAGTPEKSKTVTLKLIR